MFLRRLHSGRILKEKAKYQFETIKLRPPIVPTHKNFDVSESHPLYQFFHDKKALRKQVETDSREWNFPELRRKSFEDLHTIYYQTLKQRNIIAREVRLSEAIKYRRTETHNDVDAKLVLTQKRIKQVLLERQVAHERAETIDKSEYLESFKNEYINAENIAPYNDKLIRLQYAIFGIEPNLSDYSEEDINVNFVKGLSYVADVKASRYAQSNTDLSLPLNGVMEELPFLLKSTDEAVADVLELREQGQVQKLDKIDVIPYLKASLKQYLEVEEETEDVKL